MAQDLTMQQLLAVMAARNATTEEEYNAILRAAGLTGAPLEYRESQTYSQDGVDTQRANPLTRQITQQIDGSASNTWDPVTGKYTGLSSGMSENAQTLMALTMLAGGVAGAASAGGGVGAGTTAAGAGGTTGATAAGGTAGGLVTLTPAEIAATNAAATAGLSGQVAATMPALGAAGGAAAGTGLLGSGVTGSQAASAGATGVNAMRQGEIADYQTNGSMPSSPAVDGGSTGDWLSAASKLFGNNAGGLLGGLAGYLDSKDKEQTTSRDPWGPAQPYLKGLLSEGADLYGQIKQQPFSQSQQAAYGNVGNVLDFINANAPGLMSGFNANASGANQFSRSNPRRSLIGNSYDPATSPVAWTPGLLSSFGTRKG